MKRVFITYHSFIFFILFFNIFIDFNTSAVINNLRIQPTPSTTSNRSYAIHFASLFAENPWNVQEFYVYEIVPAENFISVTNTYLRTLIQEQDGIARNTLFSARNTFTQESEYSAINRIPAERIISATRFQYNPIKDLYDEKEKHINNNARPDNLIPAVHPNNYPFGAFRGRRYTSTGISSGFACPNFYVVSIAGTHNVTFNSLQLDPPQADLTNTGTSTPFPSAKHKLKRDKRETSANKQECPEMQTYKDDFIPQYESIEIPKTFLENKTFNLYITHQNKDYCLKLNDNYIYLSEGCKVSPKWNYTNLGQIITKINDGREEQFYCMSIDPAQTDFGQNILLSPCDLNNTGQFWQLKQSTLNNGMSFVNFNNVYLKAKKRYLYIYPKRNEKIEEIITIKNHPDLEENKTEPLIQFSIDNDKNEGNFRIFPSKQGYAIIDKRRYADSDYMTYYNAHNNMLFTNQHKNFIKPQLCYMSSLLKKRGSSWGWVWSEHCSNVDETKKEYKWYINFKSEGKYFITDNADHLLRKHNVNKYVYTAYKYWTDGYDVFTQYFILPAYLEKFAKSFSTVAIDKEKSYLKAFKVIKNDFEEKYLKCMYLEICI